VHSSAGTPGQSAYTISYVEPIREEMPTDLP
jgi:hypothetical protein